MKKDLHLFRVFRIRSISSFMWYRPLLLTTIIKNAAEEQLIGHNFKVIDRVSRRSDAF